MQHQGRETPDPAGDAGDPPAFRLAVVPGVNPAKWVRVWEQRLPDVPLVLVPVPAAGAETALRGGLADAALLRSPVDRAVLSAIPLYTETTVVVVPTDHVVVAADDVTAADLADDVLLVPDDDVLHWAGRPGEASRLPAPATTTDAVELVAAGVGLLAVPQSLARLHHRRDLTYRPVTDAPTSSVALAWVTDGASDLVEELIGIVRGRTANSSRGRAATTGAGGTGRSGDPGGDPAGEDAGRGGGTARGGPAGRGAGGRTAARRAGGGTAGGDTAGGGTAAGRPSSGRPSGGRAAGGGRTRGSGRPGAGGRGKGTGRSR